MKPFHRKVTSALFGSLQRGAATVSAVGVLLGGAYQVNAYFAKDADLKELAGDVREGRLEAQLQSLQQEWTRLKSIPEAERRSLTSFERDRLEEVTRQLQDIQRRLERLRGRQ